MSQILHSAVIIMTPLLLAAMGGLFSELAGMLNIALEGLLLISAFFSVIGAHITGSILLGVLLGTLSSMLLASILGSVTLKLKANVFITGLAANLLASGLAVVLSFRLFANKGVIVFNDIPRLGTLSVPFLQDIPILGPILFGHNAFVYFSWFALAVIQIIINKTPYGMHLRCTGENSEAVRSLGLQPDFYRFTAFLASGFFCGIGGALLSINMHSYVPSMSSGKGWIALVVIFLGNRKPLGLLAASFVFGIADAFSNYAQGALNVPADFILAIPYIFTLIAMVVFSIITQRKNRIR